MTNREALEVIERLGVDSRGYPKLKEAIDMAIEALSAQPEREIFDELTDIMKEYYFTHRYEYDEAWENGFMKCMNLIPSVYSIYEKRKR